MKYHNNIKQVFPTIKSYYEQLRAIKSFSYFDGIPFFAKAAADLKTSGDKSKHDNKAALPYSCMNVNGMWYALMRGKIYCVEKDGGLVTGKLAISKEGRIFFVKCVTFFSENFRDREELEKFNNIKKSLELEIKEAHGHEKAPYSELVVRETETYTKLYLFLTYDGLSANLLINKERNPDNTIKLSAAQLADMAIQFIQRVVEIYIRGEVHRDIKPANFAVHIYENGDLNVSLIDFFSLEKLTDKVDSYAYYHGKSETTEAYLPSVYRNYSPDRNQNDYYWGPATDLWAAFVSAEEALDQISMEFLSVYAAECIQELKDYIVDIKEKITASCSHEPRLGHPKLDSEAIKRLDDKFSNLKKKIALISKVDELTTEMMRQSLKKHCYRVAKNNYDKVKDEAVKKFGSPLLENGLNWLKENFPDKLSEDDEYQALFYDFSNNFSSEKEELEREALFNDQSNSGSLEAMAEQAFFLASNHYKMLMLHQILKEMQLNPSVHIMLSDITQRVQAWLENPNELITNNYAQEAYEILRRNKIFYLQVKLESLYRKITENARLIEPSFLPKELNKAASAVLYIYRNFFELNIALPKDLNVLQEIFSKLPLSLTYREAEAYFRKMENYAIAKNLCLNFFQHREYFKSYEESDIYIATSRDVILDEMADRMLKCDYDTLGRIFNDSLIARVLLPYALTEILDKFLDIAQLQQQNSKGVLVTYQIYCQMFLSFCYDKFFKNPKYFDPLFLQLSDGVSNDDKYFSLLHRATVDRDVEEEQYPPISKMNRQGYEESIKVILAAVTLFQSIFTETHISLKKTLVIRSFEQYRNNYFVDKKLLPPIIARRLDINGQELTAKEAFFIAIHQCGEVLSNEEESEFQNVVENSIWKAYTNTYNSLTPEAMDQLSIPKDEISNKYVLQAIAEIEKVFPSFKDNKSTSSSGYLESNFLYDLRKTFDIVYYLFNNPIYFFDLKESFFSHVILGWRHQLDIFHREFDAASSPKKRMSLWSGNVKATDQELYERMQNVFSCFSKEDGFNKVFLPEYPGLKPSCIPAEVKLLYMELVTLRGKVKARMKGGIYDQEIINSRKIAIIKALEGSDFSDEALAAVGEGDQCELLSTLLEILPIYCDENISLRSKIQHARALAIEVNNFCKDAISKNIELVNYGPLQKIFDTIASAPENIILETDVIYGSVYAALKMVLFSGMAATANLESVRPLYTAAAIALRKLTYWREGPSLVKVFFNALKYFGVEGIFFLEMLMHNRISQEPFPKDLYMEIMCGSLFRDILDGKEQAESYVDLIFSTVHDYTCMLNNYSRTGHNVAKSLYCNAIYLVAVTAAKNPHFLPGPKMIEAEKIVCQGLFHLIYPSLRKNISTPFGGSPEKKERDKKFQLLVKFYGIPSSVVFSNNKSTLYLQQPDKKVSKSAGKKKTPKTPIGKKR